MLVLGNVWRLLVPKGNTDQALNTIVMTLLICVTLAAGVFSHKPLSRSTEANRETGLSQVEDIGYKTVQENKGGMTGRQQSQLGPWRRSSQMSDLGSQETLFEASGSQSFVI